ncbi:MAG: aldose 1-epimerase family protein [Flavobacteriaceae bacterium]
MDFKLENKYLSVIIKKQGVELISARSKTTNFEYIWQGNPEFWTGQAPVLFPAIGEFKDEICFFEGEQFSIPKHGFVRHNPNFDLLEHEDNSVLLELRHSEETLKMYPYKFSFRIQYTLEKNKLIVHHEVWNLDQKTMYFCLGGHPAFNCPDGIENYRIKFDETESVKTTLLSEGGLITDTQEDVLVEQNEIQLTEHIFDRDALIFTDLQSNSASLENNKGVPLVSMDYNGFPFLGIWSKPKAPYVCIEPWIGIADHEHTTGEFKDKLGVQNLPAGKLFEADYSIKFH